jgi:exodeoxyribonuclease-5
MINNYLSTEIKRIFPFKPTEEQEKALTLLCDFLLSRQSDCIFMMRGYAGTGKTSLISALVRTLDKLKQPPVLLAPTGRAAKVLAAYSGHPAYTIHKRIYRQQNFTADSIARFTVCPNLTPHTLYIVDEASMISNEAHSGAAFGTGRLLDDLIEYVYSGEGCRLLLMGDTAQLPPVGEELSPALLPEALTGYGLQVIRAELTQVVRQESDSGILWNATKLRQLLTTGHCKALPLLRISGFARDIRIIAGGDELVDTISSCYEHDGVDETIVLCRSNKRANQYNAGIRSRIFWREEELERSDLLMVVKNNYFWTANNKETEFIANGETMTVQRVRGSQELYGFRFVNATVRFPDYNDMELDVRLLCDTLGSEAPALTKAENERLFYAVLEDYADIPTKRERMKKMQADPYFNALQVKYAYAVTCHKAQGGQWKHVFLDQAYMSPEYLSPDYFRWLYTAYTRATDTLYLINYPKEQTE